MGATRFGMDLSKLSDNKRHRLYGFWNTAVKNHQCDVPQILNVDLRSDFQCNIDISGLAFTIIAAVGWKGKNSQVHGSIDLAQKGFFHCD